MIDPKEIKQKAATLKSTIETALATFRTETGYTPEVKVNTSVKKTNSGNFVNQKVEITVTLQ